MHYIASYVHVMFSSIFARWKSVYDAMAFQPQNFTHMRRAACTEALETLQLWMNGQERADSAVDALNCIELCHPPLSIPCSAFRDSLAGPQEGRGDAILDECMHMISRYLHKHL